jgi:hypothetical protein
MTPRSSAEDWRIGEFGILNSDGELGSYPYYKAMSRGGITNGEMRYVYYNDHTHQMSLIS